MLWTMYTQLEQRGHADPPINISTLRKMIGEGEPIACLTAYDASYAALVDAGCGRSTERLFKNIRSWGVKPEYIQYLLITHCHYDHTGGAKAVK